MTLAHAIALALPCMAATAEALAQDAVDDAVELDRIVVSARLEQVPAFKVPASLSLVQLGDANRANVNLSEHLGGVPGLMARDRQNYAQDTQLSIRGFGARSTFGVRGIRLYADGIPATMPDGQGQVSHFNLLGGERVEVMRGPFSALYGNSSGGVIQLWSAPATLQPEFTVQSTYGRDNAWTLGSRVRGTAGAMGYNVAVQRFETDGWREHSAAERSSGNARLSFDLNQAGTLDVVLNTFDSPEVQDPLGLTWAQVQANPRQVAAVADTYNTRKSIRQNQLGALYTLAFGEGHTLRALAYGGQREVTQYLAIPPAPQANPLHSGGVIDLDSDYGGADLRWSWRGELAQRPLELSAGSSVERLEQQRSGYENFVGNRYGVRGQLRRDEDDDVENADQYAQAWWQFAPRWSLLLGARHSRVRFESRDHYLTAGNPDDSGRKTYSRTSPVAGLGFSVTEDLQLHLSAGRGFETPTFNEMSYRADGGAGLAFDLKPALSRNVEFGGKWRSQHGAQLEVALFRADTDDELAVARNVAGRSSYRNVGRARREGLELGARLPLGGQWRLDVAYTWLDATFRDAFALSSGEVVAADARIPGVARQQLRAALAWRGAAWNAGLEGIGVGDVVVNDAGSESAPGYAVFNAELGRQWRLARSGLDLFLRLDNLLDKAYIGSVIVNEGNGRFYEPAPGRGALLGLRWRWGGDS